MDPGSYGLIRRTAVRERRLRRIRLAIGLAGVVVAAVGVVVGRELWRDPSLINLARGSVPASVATPVSEAPVTVDAASRPAYAHSIVPGGAYTRAEVAAAMRNDAVVAAHYRTLDVAHLRPTRVEAPHAVYVSYRVGSEIYWTKRPVRLSPGETLLTDGESTIRARCGNRVSEVAQYPVAGDEPDLETAVPPAAGVPSDHGASSMSGEAGPVPFFDAWRASIGGAMASGGAPDGTVPGIAASAVTPFLTGGVGPGGPAGAVTMMTANGPLLGLVGGEGASTSRHIDGGGPNDGGPHDGNGHDGGIFVPPGRHDGPAATGDGDHTDLLAVETTGGDEITTDAVDVPEPTTLLLIGLGVGAALSRRLGRTRV